MKRDALLPMTFIAALLFAHAPAAKEITGVTIPEEVTLDGSDKPLLLNGAGIRKKLFFTIYVGALYLENRTADAQAAIEAPGAKRVLMHFVYDEVPRKKLVDAWYEGFEANSTPEALDAIKPRIDEFAGLFRDARKGDAYRLDYVPGEGTRVAFNGDVLGTIDGEEFNRALLGIWLGDKPVTGTLKSAMLGAE